MDTNIIHLALRTGFTFKKVFQHLDKIEDYAVDGYVGIADEKNTFAHAPFEILCNKNKGIKPIYGIRLPVVKDATVQVKPRGQFGKETIFIAKNRKGLKEIYNLVKVATENFYYRENISFKDVLKLSKNVIIIAEDLDEAIAHRVNYIGLSPRTRQRTLTKFKNIKRVALCDNYYPRPEHHQVYELLSAPSTENRTTPQFVLTTKEWKRFFKDFDEDLNQAIKNTHIIAKKCEGVKLKSAPMIKYTGKEKLDYLCKLGARKRKINIKEGVYKKRYEYELGLIKEKDYVDYFLVVSDMIRWAKKRMFVGPSRGSCAGSLICYLLEITEIDPIPYDLIFERFIDINRADLPDIDIDFPDTKRNLVIKYLINKYGADKVKSIATISTMKPKVAINEWAKGLRIPEYEVGALKNAIVDRSGGDARAQMRLIDTFETTEVGKEFIDKYPNMKSVSHIENHPRHHGVHAAGVIVCNKPIHIYAGISSRRGHEIVMVDRKEAEYLNLLKIDILGLRTLSIIEDCCKLIKMEPKDLYTLSLDDKKTFKLMTDLKMQGIFQFEGYSLTALARRMGVENFEDIVALTSLARPGALYSGGARRYVEYRTGEGVPEFVCPKHEEITESTYGCVVYQEQILRICREIGRMSWQDVNALRRALSKSLGKEYFNKYKSKFSEGAKKDGITGEEAEFLWSEIENGGAYAFNKSHAVAYGLISYWCAYLKAHFPLEFLTANLLHAKSEDSTLKILREAYETDGIEYTAVDPDESLANWSVKNGRVLGGLTNIHGIGLQGANKIINARKDPSIRLGKSVILKLVNPKTPFDILYPAKNFWGDIYNRPRVYGLNKKVSFIKDVQEKGSFIIIGQLKEKNIRDLNEYVNLARRGGKVYEENSLMLSIKIEDDTDSIMCNINRFRYEKIGIEIAENGAVEESWYIIRGSILYNGRYIDVEDIQMLDESLLEEDDGKK